MPKFGQPDEIWKEYSTGGGSDKLNTEEEMKEKVHGVGDTFYDGVQNSGKAVQQEVSDKRNF